MARVEYEVLVGFLAARLAEEDERHREAGLRIIRIWREAVADFERHCHPQSVTYERGRVRSAQAAVEALAASYSDHPDFPPGWWWTVRRSDEAGARRG